jgi:hypothetical protein
MLGTHPLHVRDDRRLAGTGVHFQHLVQLVLHLRVHLRGSGDRTRNGGEGNCRNQH